MIRLKEEEKHTIAPGFGGSPADLQSFLGMD